MTSISCDIVILPSDELAEHAFTMSAHLQKHNALFQLSPTGPFPHASLYMTQLKVDDLEKVKEILANIAANTPQLDLVTTRYYQAEGYIDADYARTNTLDQLQMAVVEAINPIRDGMRERDKARMLEATGKVRENLEKYGYRGVGELFRPHMTFTRFADGQSMDTSTLPDPGEFSGKFVKLGLFEMGESGTCVRKITELNLGVPIGISKPRIIIVNDQDEIIGHKERGTINQEDIYRVAALWVTNSQGDILLAQRKFTKSHDPGKWGPAVAGTLDEGETYESNIIKEAEEEIGLRNIKPTIGPKVQETGEHNYFDQWYTLKLDTPAEALTIQEDEVEQVKWFTRAELERELHEHPDSYLKGMDWCLENL